ncbi:MAG: hypothetical protein IKC02_08510, partial [Oscillospiraceae bacterium]|nr:hypothetical protein [Oscillospiraceae bacterium]
ISDVDEHTLFNSGTSYIKPIESIKSKYPILLSVAIISMILDIIYAYVDPRLKTSLILDNVKKRRKKVRGA